MNNFEKFINVYKGFELVSREKGCEVRDLENELPEDISQKLRMCRYFRNFIQHNQSYEEFLNITNEMISFLEKLAVSVRSSGDVCSKHLDKFEKYSIKQSDKICDALKKISKNKQPDLLVLDKKSQVLGLINLYDLLNLKSSLKMGSSEVSKKIKKEGYSYVEGSFPTAKLLNSKGINIIIDDNSRKILGIFNPFK